MGGCVSIAPRLTRNGSNNNKITSTNTMLIVARHWLLLSGSKTMGFVV